MFIDDKIRNDETRFWEISGKIDRIRKLQDGNPTQGFIVDLSMTEELRDITARLVIAYNQIYQELNNG